MDVLPSATRWVVVGAGFAGASTAWALARAGLGPGLILEREPTFGAHASGRNAALAKVTESDRVVRTLAVRSLRYLKRLDGGTGELLRPTGGLTLASGATYHEFERIRGALAAEGLDAAVLTAGAARRRHPLVAGLDFGAALWCADEGVVDIHALLTHYLQEARAGGFRVQTDCEVQELRVEGGRVTGVTTARGDVRADVVIDAAGAWAGRLGRARPLPLQPFRRHLFVSAPPAHAVAGLPFTWMEDAGFYFRPEGDGLLLSPCDETASRPCAPSTDPAAAELLAEKLAAHAPALADLAIRRGWACLRTFTPDRHPVIGPDSERPGLFHVSGLGGFGMMTSAAVGELAATRLAGRTPDWMDLGKVDPVRLAP